MHCKVNHRHHRSSTGLNSVRTLWDAMRSWLAGNEERAAPSHAKALTEHEAARPSTHQLLRQYYTSELAAIVSLAYSDDLQAFGYPVWDPAVTPGPPVGPNDLARWLRQWRLHVTPEVRVVAHATMTMSGRHDPTS